MSEHEDERRDDDEPQEQRSPSGRKKRKDAGKPRGARSTGTRFERRAQAVERTIRELVKLGRPNLDVEGMTFAEVVNRDVAAWGRFFAQLAEWVTPLGTAIDVAFGSSLVTVLNMLPSFRAARRELVERRERRRAERAELEAQYAEDAELRERIAAEHVVRETGADVFEPYPPPEPPLGVVPQREMTREEWLGRGGNGTT